MIKKWLTGLGIIAILGVLYGVVSQINQSLGAKGRLDQAQQEVNRLEAENQSLQEQLQRVKGVNFVERVARNNLNLAKANETVFIISDKAIAKVLEEKQMEETKLPNWQAWLRLFM